MILLTPNENFCLSTTGNKKSSVFQRPSQLVHKFCGQAVEKHVHNLFAQLRYDNFNELPIK